jgi:hypothetical protein
VRFRSTVAFVGLIVKNNQKRYSRRQRWVIANSVMLLATKSAARCETMTIPITEDNEDALLLMGAVKAAERAYYDFISAQGNDGAYFPVCIRAVIVGDDLISPMGEEAIINRIPERENGDKVKR